MWLVDVVATVPGCAGRPLVDAECAAEPRPVSGEMRANCRRVCSMIVSSSSSSAQVVSQGHGEAVFVGTDEGRLFLGDDAFHAVGHDRLEVGEVADDFQRAPFALHRPRQHLLTIHAGDRPPQYLRSVFIGANQFRESCHGNVLRDAVLPLAASRSLKCAVSRQRQKKDTLSPLQHLGSGDVFHQAGAVRKYVGFSLPGLNNNRA